MFHFPSPIRGFVVAHLAIMGCLLGAQLTHAEQPPDRAALTMVKTLHLGGNLGEISTKVTQSTTTYRGIQAKYGAAKAQAALHDQIGIVLPKYQTRWDANLASSYAEFMTPTEMESITRERSASPYFEKFKGVQGDVGGRMQEKSSELLQQAVTEILSGILAAIGDASQIAPPAALGPSRLLQGARGAPVWRAPVSSDVRRHELTR
jgi:hypothetical protein